MTENTTRIKRGQHLSPLTEFKKGMDVNNGITMCKDCHMKLHGLFKGDKK